MPARLFRKDQWTARSLLARWEACMLRGEPYVISWLAAGASHGCLMTRLYLTYISSPCFGYCALCVCPSARFHSLENFAFSQNGRALRGRRRGQCPRGVRRSNDASGRSLRIARQALPPIARCEPTAVHHPAQPRLMAGLQRTDTVRSLRTRPRTCGESSWVKSGLRWRRGYSPPS